MSRLTSVLVDCVLVASDSPLARAPSTGRGSNVNGAAPKFTVTSLSVDASLRGLPYTIG